MFEKEAKERAKDYTDNAKRQVAYECGFLDGADLGYNKANEWHFVKDGDLPPEDTKVLALMANKEIYIAHFYRKNEWDKIGNINAWKEIIPPELEESE